MEKEAGLLHLRKPIGSYWGEPSRPRPRKPRIYWGEQGKPVEPWKAPPIGTRAVVIEAGTEAGEPAIKYIKTYTKDGYITEPWTQEIGDAICPRRPRKPGRGYFREPEPASRPVKVLGPTKVVWEYVKAA